MVIQTGQPPLHGKASCIGLPNDSSAPLSGRVRLEENASNGETGRPRRRVTGLERPARGGAGRPLTRRCGLLISRSFHEGAAWRCSTVATAIVFLWTSSPTKMVVSILIRSSCLGIGIAHAKQSALRSRALVDTSGRVTNQVTRAPSGHDGLSIGKADQFFSDTDDARFVKPAANQLHR